jgi:hypothetical protein
MNIREQIDLGILYLSKGNLESIVVSNFEMCHAEGETISKMMRQLKPEEKKVVKENFYINVKANLCRKKSKFLKNF